MDRQSVLTDAQREVLASIEGSGPVVMLNLLRFRDRADYAGAGDACSGREAYARYSRTALRTIAAVGGAVLFGGAAHPALIGPDGERWDQAFLVRYPSVAAFEAMLAMPEYRAAVHHRTAALEDSRLVPITPLAP